MTDNDKPSQTETIRILASIQTTNEFILKGMTDLKTEMGKVGEVVQAHAILLQAHGTDITNIKQDSKDALKRVDDLSQKMTAPKTGWSADNVKVILAIVGVVYGLVELVKLLVNAILHPGVASTLESVAPHVK